MLTEPSELPAIAQKAINHVLRYHDSCHTYVEPLDGAMTSVPQLTILSCRGLTEPYKAIIKDRIEELLPLRSLAADPDVANIEIISDAAMSFLDAYNLEHLECVVPLAVRPPRQPWIANSGNSNPISQMWLYMGVQNLVSIDLKPALVCGEVLRLSEVSAETEARFDDSGLDRYDVSHPDVSQTEVLQPDETEDQTAPQQPQQPEQELSATPPSDDEDTAQDKKTFADDVEWTPARTPRSRKRRSSGPHVANGKDPWSDEEIKKLIKWKVHGMTHKEAGVSTNPVRIYLQPYDTLLTHLGPRRPSSAGLSPRAPSGTPLS